MIKFFRHIRQQLVMENKTSKYFKYAIGEIILVVIGILIALSINNWNETKKERISEQSYYKTVVNDLINDTILINERIRNNYEKLSINGELRNRIHSKSATFDTILNIAQDEFIEDALAIPDFNNNTFETLITSGDLSLLDTDVKDLLLTLDSEQKKIIKKVEALAKIYGDKLGRYSDSYPVPARSREIRTELEKGIWQQLDKQDFLPRFINLLDLSTFMSYTYLENLKEIKTTSTNTLELINRQIN